MVKLKHVFYSFLFSVLVTLFGFSASPAFADMQDQTTMQAKIESYFADIPIMAKIAQCESGFRQFDSSGAVLFDPSYSMIGLFQISTAHLPESIDKNMDIMTPDGNMAFARGLYTQNGTDPWMDSYSCWGSSAKPLGTVLGTSTQVMPASSVPQSNSSNMRLALGMTSSSILTLQQLLNKAGFVIATDGSGSPGQETTKFGTLTRAAVRRFQCAKAIVCSGDESTTGYGVVDDATYSALVAAQSGTTATTSSTSSFDKQAQIAQVESQITALTAQLDLLHQQLIKLSQ